MRQKSSPGVVRMRTKKIIDALQHCARRKDCADCPVYDRFNQDECYSMLLQTAAARLQELLQQANERPVDIHIKYFADIQELEKLENGDWIDLRAAESVELKAGNGYVIPLGVGMILPDGYEAHIEHRSSTFINWGILKACSGIIDNAYNGDDDQWRYGVYATRDAFIEKGDRICQFRIIKNMPKINRYTVDHLNPVSRGGFGSTGKR